MIRLASGQDPLRYPLELAVVADGAYGRAEAGTGPIEKYLYVLNSRGANQPEVG